MSLCEQGFRSKFKNIALLQKWVAKEKIAKKPLSLSRQAETLCFCTVDTAHEELQAASSSTEKRSFVN
jgi:hypothetical protein